MDGALSLWGRGKEGEFCPSQSVPYVVQYIMGPAMKRIYAKFYRTAAGGEPVREWLLGLEPDDRKTIGTDIKDVEFAWPLGKPLVDSLGSGLWEVRSDIRDGLPGCFSMSRATR